VMSAEPGKPVRAIEGQPPTLPGIFAPCAYAPRCPRADGVCWSEEPRYEWPAEAGFACHHPRDEPVSRRLDGAA
jgi:peptide/nickel transport system ATP-binding protein